MTTQGLILRRLAAGLLVIACCAPFWAHNNCEWHTNTNITRTKMKTAWTPTWIWLSISKRKDRFLFGDSIHDGLPQPYSIQRQWRNRRSWRIRQINTVAKGSCKDYILIENGNTAQVQLSGGILHLSYSDTYIQPEWTIEEGDYSYRGYTTHKATCHFMGRDWIAWYTEEILSSAGPWLLSGLPGLILKAQDSEMLFDFSYRYISAIEDTDSRYEQLSSFFIPRPHERKYFFSGSPKEMGLLYDKIKTTQVWKISC